ncbi:stage V sporulation protein AA [Bacillus sp. FJAT-42376]|uniref:stage V sporulation protein AA n=1 Tax=Bacillus sp. FJAT-42376 TaxID=2014076 RepID=UPI000F4F2DF2|nr:stage V sporulation protein AA [Bacillus sp. FJAT-42376]AZB43409.1 stage V sporulation protein AA [Bacillus sp. FJAT-42376]
MAKTVYIRLRHRIQAAPQTSLKLDDLAQVICPEEWTPLKNLSIYQITMNDKNMVVIDGMDVIQAISMAVPEADIQTIGPSQTVVEIVYEKKRRKMVYLILVWLLLFTGAAMAIINFHEDVSMQAVHQKLYFMLTGERIDKPLLLQIPYSVGLGLGMILFFNHVFKRRINEEPSPLEVEMFKYQLDLDQYVAMNENKESVKKIDDH